MAEFTRHETHVGVDVVEKHFVAGTKVVQPVLSFRSLNEPILWAFSVAGKPYFAVQAVRWKGREFILAELLLFFRYRQAPQVHIANIAQMVSRIDIVIT